MGVRGSYEGPNDEDKKERREKDEHQVEANTGSSSSLPHLKRVLYNISSRLKVLILMTRRIL